MLAVSCARTSVRMPTYAPMRIPSHAYTLMTSAGGAQALRAEHDCASSEHDCYRPDGHDMLRLYDRSSLAYTLVSLVCFVSTFLVLSFMPHYRWNAFWIWFELGLVPN